MCKHQGGIGRSGNLQKSKRRRECLKGPISIYKRMGNKEISVEVSVICSRSLVISSNLSNAPVRRKSSCVSYPLQQKPLSPYNRISKSHMP
jgi:hypothetical protein